MKTKPPTSQPKPLTIFNNTNPTSRAPSRPYCAFLLRSQLCNANPDTLPFSATFQIKTFFVAAPPRHPDACLSSQGVHRNDSINSFLSRGCSIGALRSERCALRSRGGLPESPTCIKRCTCSSIDRFCCISRGRDGWGAPSGLGRRNCLFVGWVVSSWNSFSSGKMHGIWCLFDGVGEAVPEGAEESLCSASRAVTLLCIVGCIQTRFGKTFPECFRLA